MKICKKCQLEKDLNEFYLKKDGNPRSSYCKICYNEEYKSNKKVKNYYYQANKEKFYQKHKEWLEKNKESREKYIKDWREENKEILSEKMKEYRKENTEIIKKNRKVYYQKNKEEICLKSRIKYQESDRIKEVKRNYIKKRREEDPIFKLKMNLRSLIKNSFKRIFTSKSKNTIEILGCSFDEFRIYLESKFDENMTFENYGTYWEIDHIIPISLAKSKEEVVKLNHYTNLQPLYWRDNLEKSDKI